MEFVTGEQATAVETTPIVPADYVIAPGDEIQLSVWGSVEADLRLVVDKVGQIVVPRVGPVQVSGLRPPELADAIRQRIAQNFRNFQVSATLGALRSIRIFVTGYAAMPGAHVVDALTSLSAAVTKAGWPSAAGSFRTIELRRRGQIVDTFDLYGLLLRGERGTDPLLQAGDVVHVAPVGPQVGVIGSVNRPGIFELKAGETLTAALRMAGGLNPVADRSRVSIERLRDRQDVRLVELALPADEGSLIANGDVVRAFSAVAVALPSDRQAKRVRVEGEVVRPAEYVLPAGSTLRDALRSAGGLTARAYVFASEFSRESVRQNQRESYGRALRDLETDLTRAASSQHVGSNEDAASVQARTASSARLIERLRSSLEPSGRIVLQTTPESAELPDLALEDGDRLYVPARPTTVGVFGSVFNAASYLYDGGKSLDDYLRLAGGLTKGADSSSVFVVRASGSVVSRLQGQSGLFAREDSILQSAALPGDTIFVPEEMNKVTPIQGAKDWTQVMYQFGLGLAGIKTVLGW